MKPTVQLESNPDIIDVPTLLLKPCLVIVVMLGALKVMPALISLVMLGLGLYAWRGPKESIQALTLMFLCLSLNPGLFPFWGQGASIRWFVLFSAFGRVLWDSILSNATWPSRFSTIIGLYAAVLIVLSLLASHLPAVSIFKIIAFTVGALTIPTCFYRTRDLTQYWISWFFSFFVVIVVLSLPFYVDPVGYFRNGRGFQGILNHPQTLGPFAAPVTAGLTVLLFEKGERSYKLLATIAIGLFCIYASQARTGMLMYAGSLLFILILAMVRGQLFKQRIHERILPVAMKPILLVTACIFLVVAGSQLVDATQAFVLKRATGAESKSFQLRASMMDDQIKNFKDQPLTGIGFGVPSSPGERGNASYGFLGIPTGFPVEKGFLPSAVLEETGLIGFSLFLVMILCLVAKVIQKGRLLFVAIMLASLLANVGEMIFFSFGGNGLFFWLLIGFCYTHAIPSTRNSTLL